MMNLSICLVLAAVATMTTNGQAPGLTPEVMPSLPVEATSTIPEVSEGVELPLVSEIPEIPLVSDLPLLRVRSL